MQLRLKYAVFASIIISNGAADTAQTAIEPSSKETAAETADRDLYGESNEVLRREDCPSLQFCETEEQCFNSEAADVHGVNGSTEDEDERMGGCVLRRNGRVSWISNGDFDFFSSRAPSAFSRVCCGEAGDPTESPTENPTESPTLSPTWLDDSWGSDSWNDGSSSGGSSWNIDNKWGWTGGSSRNNNWSSGNNQWNNDNKWGWTSGSRNQWNNNNSNRWGWSGRNNNQWNNNQWNNNDPWSGWQPSSWNHDGWHQDGWEDDGWNDDGHSRFGWQGDDGRSERQRCGLSDCCEAAVRGTDFSLYNRFINTRNGDNECRLRTDQGGTGLREKCNRRGFCYATNEGCQPSDC